MKQSGSDTRKKKAKKSFLKHQIYHLVTYFTVFIGSFCFVPSLTLVSLFFFLSIIFFTIFTYTLYIILLSMLEKLQILLFISYELICHQLQKNNFKHLFIIYCLSNTNNIFTTSVCKHFVVNLVV